MPEQLDDSLSTCLTTFPLLSVVIYLSPLELSVVVPAPNV